MPCKNKEETAAYNKAYYEAHKEGLLAQVKAYNEVHKEERAAYNKAYREAHQEEIRAYRETHRQEAKAYHRAYREVHQEEKKAYTKTWHEVHKKEQAAYRRVYYETHGKELNAYRQARRISDSIYRLIACLRGRVASALRAGGYSKKSSTLDIVGCTLEELKAHLEKQFWSGMTWENAGEWHVDHIIPLASAKTEGEVLKLCHFSNLQPLWADDNLSKNDRLDWTPAESKHTQPNPGS